MKDFLIFLWSKLYLHNRSFSELSNRDEVKKKYKSNNKLCLAVLILSVFFILILNHFCQQFLFIITILIIVYVALYFYITNDMNFQIKQLKWVKDDMRDSINPNKPYERLGIDILQIQVNHNLVSLVDSEQEGKLIALVAALRLKLTDKYGYIFPKVRIMYNDDLNNNEYALAIRCVSVSKSTIYPDKVLIYAKNIKDKLMQISDKLQFDGDFLEDSQNYYWINKTDAKKFEDVKKIEPDEVIIEHLEKIVMDYVEYIFSYTDVVKREVLIKAQYNDDFDNKMDVVISYNRPLWWYIFVNLLKEKISIKDLCFIAEKITFYSAKTDNWGEILNNIKKDIKSLNNKLME